jgi:hypothetical protein
MAPEDFRAELARLGLPHYIAAARVGLHPSRLSAVLWRRERLSGTLADRLWQVIQEERRRLQEAEA